MSQITDADMAAAIDLADSVRKLGHVPTPFERQAYEQAFARVRREARRQMLQEVYHVAVDTPELFAEWLETAKIEIGQIFGRPQ